MATREQRAEILRLAALAASAKFHAGLQGAKNPEQNRYADDSWLEFKEYVEALDE